MSFLIPNKVDALADNKIATRVDEKYLADTNAPMGVYRLGYYPPHVHFVMASAQMAGDGPTVVAAAEKLRGLIPDEVARDIAMVHPVKSAPYFAHAQFSAPETILALPDPGDAMPYVKAMWRYSRASPMRHSATSMQPWLRLTQSQPSRVRRISRCSRHPGFQARK